MGEDLRTLGPGVVVTSWSPKGWALYGHGFMRTFQRHWKCSLPLYVFVEGLPPPAQALALSSKMRQPVTWLDLQADEDHEQWAKTWLPQLKEIQKRGGRNPDDYRFQANRWFHKVMAVTSPALPQEGLRVWIDADVRFTKDWDDQFLLQTLPEGKALAFLGREKLWPISHSECGYVAYDLKEGVVRHLLAAMRERWVSGGVFQDPQWHDSYTFDICRRRIMPRYLLHDLTGGRKNVRVKSLSPWEASVLAERSAHYKGHGGKQKLLDLETIPTPGLKLQP